MSKNNRTVLVDIDEFNRAVRLSIVEGDEWYIPDLFDDNDDLTHKGIDKIMRPALTYLENELFDAKKEGKK